MIVWISTNFSWKNNRMLQMVHQSVGYLLYKHSMQTLRLLFSQPFL
jgi:hypothetical protein